MAKYNKDPIAPKAKAGRKDIAKKCLDINSLFLTKINYFCNTGYDLHKNFYQYLLHLDQLREFFHNLTNLKSTLSKF
ncbi:hypothetical protein BpHYR1_011256 [Brachionus plicatilis]|uniref:Uncharacterized protein n=1 Tax=Brachionus plicatilis TaxID=10195 RepID=A0A3M7RCL5_BRAPC|nr:hypothetical protein BpHYR1_011256 [Brachionus plicatilis]